MTLKISAGAIALGAMIAAMTGPANAAIVNSLAGATSVPIPAVNLTTQGPQTFGPFTFASNVAASVFGDTASYGFGSNGSWSGTPLIGLNAGSNSAGGYGVIQLTLDAPTSGFLAQLNWNPDNVSNLNTVGIQIFDSNHVALEFLALSGNNGVGNAVTPGGYYGFQRATADIKYINFYNGFIAARDISYIAPAATGAVPEPASWAMMLLGFAATGIVMRRRNPRHAVSMI